MRTGFRPYRFQWPNQYDTNYSLCLLPVMMEDWDAKRISLLAFGVVSDRLRNWSVRRRQLRRLILPSHYHMAVQQQQQGASMVPVALSLLTITCFAHA